MSEDNNGRNFVVRKDYLDAQLTPIQNSLSEIKENMKASANEDETMMGLCRQILANQSTSATPKKKGIETRDLLIGLIVVLAFVSGNVDLLASILGGK